MFTKFSKLSQILKIVYQIVEIVYQIVGNVEIVYEIVGVVEIVYQIVGMCHLEDNSDANLYIPMLRIKFLLLNYLKSKKKWKVWWVL